jgi:hypothetical protein
MIRCRYSSGYGPRDFGIVHSYYPKGVRVHEIGATPVNDNLLLVQPEVSEAIYQEYRRRSGEAMATIHLDLIKPIVKDYPDLDPGLVEPGEKHGKR